VLKTSFLLLPVVLASAIAGAQVLGQASGPNPDFQNAFGGSPLTCSQPTRVVVPSPIIERAKVKIRLLNLLRESLFDDAKGVVNIAREKEIKRLADKLKNSRTD